MTSAYLLKWKIQREISNRFRKFIFCSGFKTAHSFALRLRLEMEINEPQKYE